MGFLAFWPSQCVIMSHFFNLGSSTEPRKSGQHHKVVWQLGTYSVHAACPGCLVSLYPTYRNTPLSRNAEIKF